MSQSNRLAAVVLCAGQGTRMKSSLPKVLHPVLGRPLGAWPIALAESLGAAPVVVVVGHEAELVEAEISRARPDATLRFALQAEQRGTGHAVQVALPEVPGGVDDVLILYGDSPLLDRDRLDNLIGQHRASGTPMSLLTGKMSEPKGYGRVVRGQDGRVRRVVEERDCTPEQRALTEWNPGIYVVKRAFLQDALAQLSADNAQGELYLTDLVELAQDRGGVTDVYAPNDETLGVNDRAQLAKTATLLRDRINDHWMREGVSIHDPLRTVIEPDVELGRDVILAPNVSLKGKTRVGNGATLFEGCVLTDTVVEAGATLHPYTICESAHVGERANVGPFARLRPAAVLKEGAKVGNFVEMKKATLGKGSKANHLSYIGDATVGEGCNIGAGTITCNYDGFSKHPTVLGDGVFVGSNSTLVAPLEIEEDAYVGAGSTIDRRVPKDALAISRARQENKEGYAARIRKRKAVSAAGSRNEARKK